MHEYIKVSLVLLTDMTGCFDSQIRGFGVGGVSQAEGECECQCLESSDK